MDALVNSGYAVAGNQYCYALNYSKSLGILGNILQFFNYHVAYVIETPINDPLLTEDSVDIEKINHPLVFQRIVDEKKGCEGCDGQIKTNDKYIVVDTTKYKDFETYLASLTQHHRSSIRRFQKKLKESGGYIKHINNVEDVSEWYTVLQPLYRQVQDRNHGVKSDNYLLELIQACKEYPNFFTLHVVFNKENLAVAFGIFFINFIVNKKVNNDNDEPYKSVFVPLVGNNVDVGKESMCYHNLLAHAVNFAITNNAVLDFGYAHYRVKSVFEPIIVPQYLLYRGNSKIINFSLSLYNKIKTTFI